MTPVMRLPSVTLVAASRGWHAGAPEALRSSLWIAVAALVAVAVAAVVVVRYRMRARALRQRVEFAIVPTSTFDPSKEEIIRFGSQLSRVRSSTHFLTPRSASAVRIRLMSAGGGLMGYGMVGSERARSIMRLAGYSQVELQRVGERSPVVGLTGAVPITSLGAGPAGENPDGDEDGWAADDYLDDDEEDE